MELKHTPGPWVITEDERFPNAVLISWKCGGAEVHGSSYSRQVNAQLIAAAPVLLNACIEAVAEMRDSIACPSDEWDCFDKLCAAITKATGEE